MGKIKKRKTKFLESHYTIYRRENDFPDEIAFKLVSKNLTFRSPGNAK